MQTEKETVILTQRTLVPVFHLGQVPLTLGAPCVQDAALIDLCRPRVVLDSCDIPYHAAPTT